MERRGLGAIVLRRSANFAWYTGGADNRVDHSTPFGVADVLVTGDAEYILTANIEAQRFRDEQTPDWNVVEYPWYADPGPLIRELAGGDAMGADAPIEGALDISGDIAPLRYILDDETIERYRRVARDAVAAVNEAAESLQSGMSETEATANLVAACRRHNLFAPVAMAAGDDRIARFRHPITHPVPFQERVMLVVCAERAGLYANLTRFVHFTPPSPEWRRRLAACETILGRMREEATRPGRTLADAFDDCRRFYDEAGFPDEWKLHHQGGLTGFATREVLASPEATQAIEVGQAFAWNPSISGSKAEETIILTGRGPEIVTASADSP